MCRRTNTLALAFTLFACIVACVNAAPANDAGKSSEAQASTEHRVMAFYYPWYGVASGPGGAGRTIHWGRIDAASKDISESTHYPALGAYDSHDPAVIEQHCQWAKASHIDTLIVSWWGHGDYAWFELLNGPQAEPILHDLFTFLADRFSPNKR